MWVAMVGGVVGGLVVVGWLWSGVLVLVDMVVIKGGLVGGCVLVLVAIKP